MQILNSLIPIFSIIGLGMLLRRREFLTAESTQAFNRFAYWYGLPLFLFYKLATSEEFGLSLVGIPGALLVSVLLTLIAGCLIVLAFRVPVGIRGAMIQATFRGNLAFMGLPLILFLIEDLPADQKSSIESAVIVAMAPIILFFNIASIVALAIWNEDSQQKVTPRELTRTIAGNPLVWACIAGIVFQLLEIPLPVSVQRTCSIVGSSAFPMALLGIGSQLISISGKSRWSDSVLPTVVKCVLGPLAGFAVGTVFGLSQTELQVTVLMCGMPTAVSSFVLADQMKADADFAASVVVFSTAFSLPTLCLLIWLT